MRHFPAPVRYYESLHSIMDMVDALSRRRDMSYYAYLQRLLYPDEKPRLDPMPRKTLLKFLRREFSNAPFLLSAYLDNIHNFYGTRLGEFPARDEVRRNGFRSILAKALDRLHNTRDLTRENGFTIPQRLYGTGFKNIFFIQAVEDKTKRKGFNTEERRLIEVAFLNKIKVAALYQILDDIEELQKTKTGRKTIQWLERDMEQYKKCGAFRRLTRARKTGLFDGVMDFFNEITLGRKSNLAELDKNIVEQARVLVAFRAVLEAFLVYPALIREDLDRRNLKNPNRSAYRRYRITGMGPHLERRTDARADQGLDQLKLKTFNRRVE